MRSRFDSWVGKIHWRRERLPTPVFLGFPCGSASKESACSAGDLDSIPRLGRYTGEGKGYTPQYGNPERLSFINRASLIAQLVVKNLPTVQETRFLSLGRENPLEKELTTHSSILAWKIPWTEEPGRLQSMGSQRVRHDWATNTSLHPPLLGWIVFGLFYLCFYLIQISGIGHILVGFVCLFFFFPKTDPLTFSVLFYLPVSHPFTFPLPISSLFSLVNTCWLNIFIAVYKP